jgi:hypothetical protein
LVSDNLVCPAILGTDFLAKTGLVMDLRTRLFHFPFDPSNRLRICTERNYFPVEPDFHTTRYLDEVDESSLPDLSHLSEVQIGAISQLLEDFSQVFTSKLGLTSRLEYDTQLTDTLLVRSSPYRLSPPKMNFLHREIQNMLDKGIIRHSVSPYSSPIFLVPKSETDFRPVVDYRALNKKIEIESVPLPDIHSCFHWFAGATVFSTLDLNSVYYQIPLSERSRQCTAFATDWNLFEFCRVPFGITTGAQVLTRLLDKIFSDVKFKFVYHYLDDLVVFSSSFDEHILHLRKVFSRLQHAGVTVNPAKVKFAARHLSFLGHLVSPAGVTVDPASTRALRNFPAPKDAKGVAHFIGMVNFFHKFIPDLAHRAAPLNDLRKKGVKFKWGQEQQTAFSDLKMCIMNPPVLAMADFSQRFVLQPDANSSALVVVLLQEVQGLTYTFHSGEEIFSI